MGQYEGVDRRRVVRHGQDTSHPPWDCPAGGMRQPVPSWSRRAVATVRIRPGQTTQTPVNETLNSGVTE